MIRRCITFWLVIGVYQFVFAQTASIEVIGRLDNQTVTLRWAPSSAIAWQLGNKYGYRVYRYAINNTGDSLTTEKQLVASGLKPLPVDKWEPLVKDDNYAAIAAQALYGEKFDVTNPGADAMSFMDQVNEQESRFGFSLHAADLSIKVAEAMGLRLQDKIPNREIRWGYRVELEQNPTEYKVNSGVVLIDPQEDFELPPPKEVQAEFNDHSVRLNWTSLYDYGIYVAYNIERSTDGGKTYEVRNMAPVAIVSKANRHRRKTYYYDSLEVNYKLYYYRIRGLTPFGDTGPPSEPVYGAGLGSAKGLMASIDSSAVTQKGEGYIRWYFPEHKRHNLLGYKVGRASSANGPYTDISDLLAIHKSDFLDPYPNPVNYYVVKAVGRDSVVTQSMPVLVQPIDSFPPSTPVGLTGTIDSTGTVYLDWKPNKEPDIAGYRIFRANTMREEFVQITVGPVGFSDYKDNIPLQTLTEEVYYKVIAVDHHDNPSEYSAPIELKRPDQVPPVAPTFTKWQAKESGIILEWINSSSQDVAEHILLRMDEENNKTEIEINREATKFSDKNVLPGKHYTYLIMAKDDAGLLSTPSSLEIQAFNDGIRPVIADIEGKADRENRRVLLAWKYPTQDVKRFLIYRKKGDDPMRLLKAVDGEDLSFSDINININNSYTYRIKAIFNNDDETGMSEEVRVNY